jgi:hypothetical protein
MNALPWLFVHGSVVWQLALAAGLLVALGVAFARPRLAARRAASAARARLGTPLASLAKLNDGMRLTLTGRLEAEGEPARRFEDGGDAAAVSAAYLSHPGGGAWITGLNLRAEGLALVVGDARVALDGPVEVVAGSREVRRGQALGEMPGPVQDRVDAGFKLGQPHFRDHLTTLRSVASGDLVRVSGVLRKEASAGEGAGYRGAAARWALVPDGFEAQAALGASATGGLRVAFEGAPRVSGPLGGSYVRHLMAGALVGGGLVVGGGAIALGSARGELGELALAPVDPQKPPRDAGMTATAITAATPFRLAAVDAMVDALDVRHDEDLALVERRAALHELQGDCVAAGETLARQGQLERGAEVAERCGGHRFAAQAFYAAGDFARASAAWERAAEEPVPAGSPSAAEARFGVRVHLIAGRAALAAKEAGALVARSGDRKGETEAVTAGRVAQARCLAVALTPPDGATALVDRKKEELQHPIYPACAILLADLRRGKDRLDFIHGLTDFQSSAREVPMRWLELLEAEADPGVAPGQLPPLLDDPSLLVLNPSAALTPTIPGLDRAIAEALAGEHPDVADPRRRTRGRAAAMAAVFAAVTGEAEAAQRFVATAKESVGAVARTANGDVDDGWDHAHAWALSAAVELALGHVDTAERHLHTADTTYVTYGLAAALDYRARRDTSGFVERFLRWGLLDDGVNRAYALAAEGDGAALADWLRRPSSEVGSYLRLGAPLIKTGGDDVLRWIRVGYRVPPWFRSPSDLVVYWTELATAAAALGDAPLAATLAERAGRFRTALLRRDLAVPLAVLERL